MSRFGRARPPMWFWIVATVFSLWGVMGIAAFYMDLTMSDEAKAALPEWDRNFMATRPAWFMWCYGVAVWSGFAAGLALLLRRALARSLFALSLVAVVIQFGYVFLASDILAVKGVAATVPFPLFIVAMAAAGIWFAGFSRIRGWLA